MIEIMELGLPRQKANNGFNTDAGKARAG